MYPQGNFVTVNDTQVHFPFDRPGIRWAQARGRHVTGEVRGRRGRNLLTPRRIFNSQTWEERFWFLLHLG